MILVLVERGCDTSNGTLKENNDEFYFILNLTDKLLIAKHLHNSFDKTCPSFYKT